MKLYMQRHAHAVSVPALQGRSYKDFTDEEKDVDRRRPLTDIGKQQAHNVALQLRMRGVRPKVILASPFMRTAQTASILGDHLGVPVMLSDMLEPHRDLDGWIKRIMKGKEPPVPDSNVYLVGHHDNLVGALTELGGYEKDDVGKMQLGEVRKLKISKEGDWIEKWRLVQQPPASGIRDPAPVVAKTG